MTEPNQCWGEGESVEMVKFSVDRDEDEEEEEAEQRMEEVLRNRARMRKKQKRVVDDDSDGRAGNLDGDDEDYGSVTAAEQEESGLSVILTDPEVLDCSICMEPLSSPVFQCENGHIACSQCCTKLLNKCPSCSWPIGYSRCLAIEKVIDAIKVSCRYKPYGCRETFSYTQKHTHEEMCICTPCPCPISSCDFRGSSKQLSLHFSSKHRSSGRRFGYNCPFTVSFGKLESYLVFQEFNDGPLFVLSNQIELIGSAIRVACLDPNSSNGGFLYDLVAKKEGSALRLQSRTKCVKERSNASSSADFLLVPYEFFCSSGKLKLEICIRSVCEVESVAHEMFSS